MSQASFYGQLLEQINVVSQPGLTVFLQCYLLLLFWQINDDDDDDNDDRVSFKVALSYSPHEVIS